MSTSVDSPDLAVRRELGLADRHRRSRPSCRLRLSVATALLCGLGAEGAKAQAPYRLELIPGFSSLDVGGFSDPALADLDGDGDLDAIVGEGYGGLRYFANTGSSSAPAFFDATGSDNPFTGIDVGWFAGPALGDLDGDGDLDAVVSELGGTLLYFTNTGSVTGPAFVQATGTDNPFHAIAVDTENPALIDLDGDGDLDVVAGQGFGALLYLTNIGSTTVPVFIQATGTDNPFDGIDIGVRSTPTLVDLDGDRDLDAIAGHLGGTLVYFTNTGSSTAPAFLQETGAANPVGGIDVGYFSSPELGDLDGDGDLDALVGDGGGALSFFINTGSSVHPAFRAAEGTEAPPIGIVVGSNSSPKMVDLDGDGDLDAVIGAYDGTLRYFVNIGSSLIPAFLEPTDRDSPLSEIDVGYFSSPDLVDLDADGDLDAIVGESGGALRYFVNTGSSATPAFLDATGPGNPFAGIDVGYDSNPELVDLDLDGDIDAIVGADYGTLRYFTNTGSSTAPAFLEATGTDSPFDGIDADFHSGPELVDLDGDGDLDLVLDGYGALRFFSNTGSASVPAFLELTGQSSPLGSIDAGYRSNPELVDLDGDGDLDALIGEYGGRIVFFRSLAADVFGDGFESGDTSHWSATLPP